MVTGALARLVFTIAFAASAGIALAGAVSLDDSLTAGVASVEVPSLLAPILSAGRKGWDCTPERAASTRQASEADLPI